MLIGQKPDELSGARLRAGGPEQISENKEFLIHATLRLNGTEQPCKHFARPTNVCCLNGGIRAYEITCALTNVMGREFNDLVG